MKKVLTLLLALTFFLGGIFAETPSEIITEIPEELCEARILFFTLIEKKFYFLYEENNEYFLYGGNLKAEFSIKDTDTTFYGNEIEFESNSMKYSLVTIGKGSVGLTTVMSATNQGFWENYNLSLVTTESIISLFDIESSFDNAMWFPDNPTVYDNEVKIVDNNQDMFELLVTHKEYEVIFKGDDLDYDTKVSTQTETRYVYSPQEIKFVEK